MFFLYLWFDGFAFRRMVSYIAKENDLSQSIKMLNPHKTLNCAGTLLSLENPIVMGILNITADSFYDGGKYSNETSAQKQVEKMLMEGAAIIDIGAMSSRPGATLSTPQEEIVKLIPLIGNLRKEFPSAILSIDTIHAEVADECIKAGAHIINDISGGSHDEKMLQTVCDHKNIPFVLMHMQGTPQSMQNNPTYNNVTMDILDYFIEKTVKMVEMGFKDVIIDPGFGFGKTIDQNYELLKSLHVFKMLDWPILVGISRKSMLYKFLDIEAEDALPATAMVNLFALQEGAKILRVHDVKEAMQAIKIYKKINQS